MSSATAASSVLRRHWPAALCLAAYLLLAGAYGWLVPLGETPDEVGHFQFIRYVAEHRSLPIQQMRPDNEVGEGHQAPLYYLLGGALTATIDASDLSTLRRNPDLTFTVDDVGNKNAMLHTLAETWPPTGFALAWRIARLLSILAGLATGLLAYAFALIVFSGSRSESTFALATLALNPQWVFISAGVGTDSLAAATGSALLLATSAILVAQRPSRRSAIWLGLAVGLAILTKLTLAVLAAVCVAAIAIRLRRDLELLASRAIVAGAVGFAVVGWWMARNFWLYRDPFALNVDRAQNPGLIGAGKIDFQLIRSLLLTVRDSYFARFGWMNVAPPILAYDILTALLGVAVAGILLWLVVAAARRRLAASGTLVALCVAGIGAFVVALLVFAIGKGPSGYQGRYLFPVAAAVAICLAVGLLVWMPSRRRWLALAAVGLLGVAASSYALSRIILPAYPPPLPLNPPSRPVQVQRAIGASIGQDFSLVGCDLVATGWRSGSDGNVTLYWKRSARGSEDYTVFVHLVSADGRLVAQHDGPPGGGLIPTSFWLPGETAVDRHSIPLAAVPPGSYELRVGMYDRRTMARLAARGPGVGLTADYVSINVTVRRADDVATQRVPRVLR